MTDRAARDVVDCPEVTAAGLRCRKKLYRARNGEDWPHAGGHWFSSDTAHDLLTRGHYDAGSLLAAAPTPAHLLEDCPDLEGCRAAHRTRD